MRNMEKQPEHAESMEKSPERPLQKKCRFDPAASSSSSKSNDCSVRSSDYPDNFESYSPSRIREEDKLLEDRVNTEGVIIIMIPPLPHHPSFQALPCRMTIAKVLAPIKITHAGQLQDCA